MDFLGRLGSRAAFLGGRGLKRVWMIALVGWLTSCSSSNPPSTISTPPESFNETKQRISSIRELPFKRDVSLAKEPPNATAGLPERISAHEYGTQPLVNISHAYKRIGLLPESTDFAAALADYVRLERIFFYEARKDLIVISPDTIPLMQTITAGAGVNIDQLPVALALSRSLQEQHFQWQAKLNAVSLEDRRLAFRALAGGDTVLVGTAYLQGTQQTTRPPDSVRVLAGWATALEKMSSHLPQVLQQKLVFPYREGSQFVQWAHAVRGWTGINALYIDPPLSTAQIFYPEKYYVKRENPLDIRLSGLARQMKESAAVDQTLGQYLVQVLLMSNLPRQEAQQIAVGWSGDQLLAYPEGENLLTVWITAWKRDEDARAFYRAYQNLLQWRHRLRFLALPGLTDSLGADVPGGRLMLLQLVGSFVLLLDGARPTRTVLLADEAWKSLEAETESNVILFDSAKGLPQLSLRSR